MRRLATYDDIIKRLGGVHAVAKLTKRNPQAVFNWRPRGFFPTVLYFVMIEELERRGFTAARHLWRFQESNNNHVRREDAA
jgi:hypothetical protein